MRACLLLVLALALLPGTASAQTGAPPHELPLALKVDLVVSAGAFDDPLPVEYLCVYLPEEASTVTVSRRPLVSEVSPHRPLYMSIRPGGSTAIPLVERVMVAGDMSLTIPDLGLETCFDFHNPMSTEEAQGAQMYRYYAQIVHLEVR